MSIKQPKEFNRHIVESYCCIHTANSKIGGIEVIDGGMNLVNLNESLDISIDSLKYAIKSLKKAKALIKI